jgi:hypothetical protein
LLAAGAAALIAVSGCGSDTSGSIGNISLSASEALQHSAQQAQSVTSYAADLVIDATDPDHGSGKIQGTMVLQQKPELAGDITLTQMSFGGQSLPGGMRVILQGDTAYVKVDLLKTLVGATKPWIKFDLTKLGAAGGVDVKQLISQAQQVDLQSSVKLLTASKDAKAVGTETVGGVDTTHYTGTFSVADAAKQLTPDLQQKVQGELSQVKDMKFDAWIDAQNLPRKIVMTGATGGKGTFTMTALFKSFNQPVQISAPPADQVGELPSSLGNTGN